MTMFGGIRRWFLPMLFAGAALHAGASAAGPVVRVQGNHFVDAGNQLLQLRGVNMGGFGPYAIQGWAWTYTQPRTYDNWGQQEPQWPVFATWGINIVRLPLNEASWLGLTTYDTAANNNGGPDGHAAAQPGNSRLADPGGNYRKQYIEAVQKATSLGLYVIVDLHAAAPNITLDCAKQAAASGTENYHCAPGPASKRVPMTPFLPDYTQSPLPDADHSVTFWTSVATTFKAYPNVIFDLYNEPFIEPWFSPPVDQWTAWLEGTTVPFYYTGGSKPKAVNEAWQSVGMQTLVNTVRATGATNVVLCGGLGYAGEMDGWLSHMPKDPLHQLAASWHAYPKSSTVGDSRAKIPAWGTVQYSYVEQIAKEVPVIIGETGDHSADGTVGAPFVSVLLPWADKIGLSYLGWTWNVWGQQDHDLIKSFDGTPSDGYGVYFRDHLRCRAAWKPGDAVCK